MTFLDSRYARQSSGRTASLSSIYLCTRIRKLLERVFPGGTLPRGNTGAPYGMHTGLHTAELTHISQSDVQKCVYAATAATSVTIQ